MTALVAGAASNNRQYWDKVRRLVYRIQLRIAKAVFPFAAGSVILAFERLELYDGKLSRTVLRGKRVVRP